MEISRGSFWVVLAKADSTAGASDKWKENWRKPQAPSDSPAPLRPLLASPARAAAQAEDSGSRLRFYCYIILPAPHAKSVGHHLLFCSKQLPEHLLHSRSYCEGLNEPCAHDLMYRL